VHPFSSGLLDHPQEGPDDSMHIIIALDGRRRNLFAEHFGHEENNDRSEQTSASKQIDHGVTSGGEHVWNY
jgi:hypothetical protein